MAVPSLKDMRIDDSNHRLFNFRKEKMMRQAKAKPLMVFVASALLLAACGGGGIHPTIGGKVSGLESGLSVTLQNNYAGDLTVAGNQSFTFATASASDTRYSVTVLVQPRWQKCVVINGIGAVDAAGSPVENVAVNCAYTASVGGDISGLGTDGRNATFSTNGVFAITSSAGKFSFPKLLPPGSTYDVTVITQPAGYKCTVPNPTGTVLANAMVWVPINCI